MLEWIANANLQPITSVVSLIIALVAVVIGPWVPLTIVRRQAASSLQLEWINGLRKDVADFVSAIGMMPRIMDRWTEFKPDSDPPPEFVECERKMEEAFTLVELRLNPDAEKSHKDLLSSMGPLIKTATARRANPMTREERRQVEQSRHEVLVQTRTVLREERERIAKGNMGEIG